MGDFERDTHVEGKDGNYTAQVSPGWKIWGPNGGYVAAIAMRAAAAEAEIQRPVAFAAHFLRFAKFEAADLRVELVHRGRSSESIRVSMSQAGKPVLEGLLRTASELPGLEHDVAVAPEVPGPDGLKNWSELRPEEWPWYPFWKNFEGRPTDTSAIRLERAQGGEPIVRDWMRFVPRSTFDDPFMDAARMLLLMDTMMWPAAVQLHRNHDFIAPNLDVVAWFHRPGFDSEWLLADAYSPIGEAGLLAGHQRVWSGDRKLLATGGAQLLCVPAPAS